MEELMVGRSYLLLLSTGDVVRFDVQGRGETLYKGYVNGGYTSVAIFRSGIVGAVAASYYELNEQGVETGKLAYRTLDEAKEAFGRPVESAALKRTKR